VIEVRQGDVVLGEPAPLTFIDMPELALTPSEGLAVGDVITVEGRGLNPSQPYMLFLCGAEGGSIFECTPDLSRLLQSDAAGTLRTTVAAPLTVGQYGFCGNGCKVGLSPMWGGPDATAPFDLIDGAVTATPSTDLVDGQQVQVEGTDLLPTYTGTPRWFETGGWALVQCDSALLDRVDLVAVFTHCGIPAGGGAVDVPGTTSSNAVNVTRDLTTIVGTAVDCGAAPGRCVVGLVRYEQDATVTDHLAPLTFSPG
jgi:hypothetical protein